MAYQSIGTSSNNLIKIVVEKSIYQEYLKNFRYEGQGEVKVKNESSQINREISL